MTEPLYATIADWLASVVVCDDWLVQVMGIWRRNSDGTDINAVDVDFDHQLVMCSI